MPDWSAINSRQAKDALVAILDAFGADECWRGYTPQEDLVRSAIIGYFSKAGHAPSLVELEAVTGIKLTTLKTHLERLRQRDLVVMDTAENIIGAYPLTDRETDHKVQLAAHTVNAMCAIDALGAGTMFGEDIHITSSCRSCRRPIEIGLKNAGAELGPVTPAGSVVWVGIRTSKEESAADTLCTVICFFCCQDHLEMWRDQNQRGVRGYSLSIKEGLQVGRALFGPTLRESESKHQVLEMNHV
ncbi:MAG: alkylmercury lyase family protein [Gammaproteobacteria bacterium]